MTLEAASGAALGAFAGSVLAFACFAMFVRKATSPPSTLPVVCAFCGQEAPADLVGPAGVNIGVINGYMRAHAFQCEAHPLSQMTEDVTELRARMLRVRVLADDALASIPDDPLVARRALARLIEVAN